MSESREIQAIRRYMVDSGIPHEVTATLGRFISPANPCAPHSAGSYHCAPGTDGAGLAVDFAGPHLADELDMASIFHAFMQVSGQLAELIHNPTGALKDGRIVDGARAFGLPVWSGHRNHVHVAVRKGTFVRWPAAPVRPAPAVMTVPIPVHDFEEAAIKSTLVFVTLDGAGKGWADWDPVLGRDPVIVGAIKQGPSPPDEKEPDGSPSKDPYWESQAQADVAVQPRGGKLRVVVRSGKAGDTVGVWVAVA